MTTPRSSCGRSRCPGSPLPGARPRASGSSSTWSAPGRSPRPSSTASPGAGEIEQVAHGHDEAEQAFSQGAGDVRQPSEIALNELAVLGPVEARKWELPPAAFPHELAVEEWSLPGGRRTSSSSPSRSRPDEAESAERAFHALLNRLEDRPRRSSGAEDSEGAQVLCRAAALGLIDRRNTRWPSPTSACATRARTTSSTTPSRSRASGPGSKAPLSRACATPRGTRSRSAPSRPAEPASGAASSSGSTSPACRAARAAPSGSSEASAKDGSEIHKRGADPVRTGAAEPVPGVRGPHRPVGDSLSSIAQDFYGDPARFRTIFEAIDVLDYEIFPGQELRIPQ